MTQNTPGAIWNTIQNGVFVIAEAGKNFIQTEEERPIEEYLKNACALVDAAAAAGADAIKFQTHTVQDEQLNIEVVSPHFKGSDRYRWVTRNTHATPVDTFWKPLKAYCDKKNIIFFSTPMSRESAQKLDSVGVNVWKIGSGDILDFVTLDYIRTSGKPIIISSGMSTLEEVEKSLAFLRKTTDKIALLHCVSKYPCPPEELHLKTIEFYKERFNLPIGFSDHSIEVDPVLTAVAMGATVIEKHFSMSRTLWGADHKVSLTPEEFTRMVHGIREVQSSNSKRDEILGSDFAQKTMGGKAKILQESEAVFRPLFRKSLMAGQDIPAGTVVEKQMVYAMRPQQYAHGLPSEEYETVIGKTTTVALKKYDPITADVIQ